MPSATSSSPQDAIKQPTLIDPRTRFNNIKLALPPQSFPVLERDFPEGSKADHGETSYKGHGRLAGRRALITGGDSGNGRAVAIAMAREGAKVAINYLPEEEPDAESLARFLAKEGIKIVRLPGNLLSEAFCDKLVEDAEKALGGLDILVSNAGYIGIVNTDITTYTTEQFDRVMRTNVYAGFFLTRAAVPKMPPGSSIIFTVSDVVYTPSVGDYDYAASKGALAGFIREVAPSLAGNGIRINGVAPGVVYTPLLAATGVTTEQVNEIGPGLPLGRPAQPAEMAPMYVDFADANATYTSGAICKNSGAAVSFDFSRVISG